MRKIKKYVKRAAWGTPEIYFPLFRTIHHAAKRNNRLKYLLSGDLLRVDRIVTLETDLVIEGYPRSANTFAEQAFRYSQPFSVRLAHHLHIPAQIVYACKRRIPAVVLIRYPEDAVISAKLRNPESKFHDLLMDWISFYRIVFPYRDRFVLAEFKEVTTDFGEIISRINKHYGTGFHLFHHTDENAKTVFREIERMNASKFGNGKVVEHMVARPSITRNELRRDAYRKFYKKEHKVLIREAKDLYEALVNKACFSPNPAYRKNKSLLHTAK